MTIPAETGIRIPADLLPADGRFGSGPSKIRPEAVRALVAVSGSLLGTSHRQDPVLDLVGRVKTGLRTLFSLPAGYEIVLGNGGTNTFWDVASFGLIERRSQHLAFGEFSGKFAKVAKLAPHLADPQVLQSEVGTRPSPRPAPDIDFYALTHNETSTGVAMTPYRPAGMAPRSLVAVDATSAAGGLRFDAREVDAYYFAPQKAFASDGGLWFAALSPAALERAARITASGRWSPPSLDLSIAIEASRKNQTNNTPALATLVLMAEQIDWMLDGGGLEFAAGRSDRSAAILYDWAEKRPFTDPFVADPADRSHVVATIDFDDAVPAATVAAVLRANGVVDTEPYRRLGRNQLRIGMFPAVDPEDVEALTACIDHIVDALG